MSTRKWAGEARLLIVDDDSEALMSLSRALRAGGLEIKIEGAAAADTAKDAAHRIDPHVVILDLCLNPQQGVESGFELLRWFNAEQARTRVIVLTGHASSDHGIRALQMGAAHFLPKPPEMAHLLALIRDSIEQSALRREHAALARDKNWGELERTLVGVSPAIERVRSEMAFAARTPQPVVITGETGTGKGLCAHLIHRLSDNARGKFVRYQPNFASADLVNSELFGHVQGAFTGAAAERRGLLQEADGGTLFLDEIEELPLETQVALLGVLQEQRYRPLGSNKEEQSIFKLVCASNQSLRSCCEAGKLRSDFYHRIVHLQIHLTPLRERKDDIEPLARNILESLAQREELSVIDLGAQTLARLRDYDWPGNVRELEAVLQAGAYRAVFAGRKMIEVADLSIDTPETGSRPKGFHDLVEEFKSKLVAEALAKHAGNQVQAAKELGLDRTVLRRIIMRAGPRG